jgi:hypothetical protein
MADTKISALPTGAPAATSILPVVNGTTTQRVTVQQLLDIVGTVEGPAGAEGPAGPAGVDGPAGLDGESVTVFDGAVEPTALRVGDVWLAPTPGGETALRVWSGTAWDDVAVGGTDSHIVSAIEPPPGTEVGQLWIDPDGDLTVTPGGVDVLAAIKGQVIAPKAIDLDGPNTLYITSNPDGTAKLTLRVDGTPLKGIVEESVATEEWVLANTGNIYVGTTAPGNLSTLWLNPAGNGGGGIAPDRDPPFVVSELAPSTTSSIWINPKE